MSVLIGKSIKSKTSAWHEHIMYENYQWQQLGEEEKEGGGRKSAGMAAIHHRKAENGDGSGGEKKA